MKVTFAQVDRETLYLLPPSIQDWLPEKHLARFVVEIVEQIDLRHLKASYSGRGSQPYNPEMLVALLFYGYATGVFSSRKLERSTYDSWLSATSLPTAIPTTEIAHSVATRLRRCVDRCGRLHTHAPAEELDLASAPALQPGQSGEADAELLEVRLE